MHGFFHMDLKNFDFNLLKIFNAIFKEGNITAAAKSLDLSQPTVSTHLNKLREEFNDPLFVKNAHGLDPTPLALSMSREIEEIIHLIEDRIFCRSQFDPKKTTRKFTISTGEIGQILFFERIFSIMREEAKFSSLKIINTPSSELKKSLEDGMADIAIGHFPHLNESNLFQQLLYEKPLVCVAKKGHRAFNNSIISINDFLDCEHAIFASENKLSSILDEALRKNNQYRKVSLELSNVYSAPTILKKTDFISVLPEAIARTIFSPEQIEIAPLPFNLSNFEIKQFWHRRVNKDPAVIWLREMIKKEFQNHKNF